MGIFSRFSLSRDIGIDLGTANTLIYVSGKGIVLNEPSIIAIDQSRKVSLAVGEEAKKMLGRTPANVIVVRPLRDGVITDFLSAMIMIQEFIRQANEGIPLGNPRMIIGVPSGITDVERRAVIDAAREAGARKVGLVEEPVAAALGAGLPITEATGNMIVDIGGGTTEVAILSLQGQVFSQSIRVAGDELTESIIQYVKKVHNMIIGERTAEEIKIRLASAYPIEQEEELTMEVRGLHLLSGLPRSITLRGGEIRECMSEPLAAIVEAIKSTLEHTPPELASDIMDRGIILAGGGALLKGIDILISHETGIVTHIAEDPLHCVVKGTEEILKNSVMLDKILYQTSKVV
ncbi:MAG: cell shape determining protein, MreB/Mrl family [Candidatus Atelocyanobacterium thalassa isolate SIO64986]|uniref:Cell shape-determining protein MreB n=1 Tax=Candidatus Atelocyanobacterium thalassa isolate SIO64986 TaxID=1527444 RepID=A0A086CGG5_9CHRO|nr:MAG: cell shape determining protein, MreB/Mrl family [Candidatus Atelocyanobacterium thalassa isolate SIO64986]